jgi:NAD(P)-dependent dehydrogenase (short-subunit alcohol dehydrogenase family)
MSPDRQDCWPMNRPLAIVVGASRELGRAVAMNLVGSGCVGVAVDRNADKLGELLEEVHREVADASDPAPLIDRMVNGVGPPDVQANALGVFRPGEALVTTPDPE